MIVKVRTQDEGWLFFPVTKNVKVKTLTEEQCKFGLELNTPNFIEISMKYFEVGNKQKPEVVVLNIGGIIVYTTEMAYLLNDEGKTIEKLN